MDGIARAPLTNTKKPQRDHTLDVLKGIGITLMVLGHCGFPFTDFVYLFHMAIFFIASGYLWNDKKVKDIPTAAQSILARIKGLWFPFFLANGIFTLCNNLFVNLHIYTPDSLLSTKAIAINFFKNILFAGDTKMGGASWFFRTLFMVSVANIVIRYVVTRLRHGKVLFHVLIVFFFVGAEVINQTRWKFPMGVETVFCGYSAFLMGMGLRKFQIMEKLKKYRLWVMIGAFLILLALSPLDGIGLGVGNIGSLPFFIAVSLAGWFAVWYLSSYFKGPLAIAFCYLGKHSVWVVFLHFLSFKPVALIYLLVTGNDIANLSAFPVYSVPHLWIAYCLAGTLLPIALCWLVEKLKTLLAAKFAK